MLAYLVCRLVYLTGSMTFGPAPRGAGASPTMISFGIGVAAFLLEPQARVRRSTGIIITGILNVVIQRI